MSRSQSKCTNTRPTPPSTAHHTHSMFTPLIARPVFVITIVIVIINRYAMIFYQHQTLSCLGTKLPNMQDLCKCFERFLPRLSWRRWPMSRWSSRQVPRLTCSWKWHLRILSSGLVDWFLASLFQEQASGLGIWVVVFWRCYSHFERTNTTYLSQVGWSATFTGNCSKSCTMLL